MSRTDQDPPGARHAGSDDPARENVLWQDAAVIGGPPGFWKSYEDFTEEEARELLLREVGFQPEMVRRMSAEEAMASVARIRSVVQELTASSETDDLTGAMLRGAGLAALRREIARIGRTDNRLVVAFIDVDGLKSVNDRQGHLAGDQLLHEVVACLREQLRPYDLVIRYAGDEFVCVLLDADLQDVESRFCEVKALLAGRTGGGSMSVGMTEFRPGDSVEDLVGRADHEMYATRRQRAAGHAAAEGPAGEA
ncbi:MAG: GGDEF domain-containing protein [Actinobacteria bacterium]|nr:GGDEF domain-containing protein [Actinomycetota bacterium]